MNRVPGTCVSIGGHGVLLRGPSGSGKSDLALRLIEDGAVLVADDQIDVTLRGDRPMAAAPAAIWGMLEVRGLGILRLEPLGCVEPTAVIDPVAPGEVPRMPEPLRVEILGVALPAFRLLSFEPSAPAKVRLAVRLCTGAVISVS